MRLQDDAESKMQKYFWVEKAPRAVMLPLFCETRWWRSATTEAANFPFFYRRVN